MLLKRCGYLAVTCCSFLSAYPRRHIRHKVDLKSESTYLRVIRIKNCGSPPALAFCHVSVIGIEPEVQLEVLLEWGTFGSRH